jgi:facilitated trehalose transporter
LFSIIFRKPKHFSISTLKKREVILPLLIGLTLLVFQELTGIDVVIFNTVQIFHSAGSTLDSHSATIIVGAVQVLSNILAIFIVDKAGRKPLFVVSGIAASFSMATMGFSFHLRSGAENDIFGFLPLVSLLVFIVGYSIGFGSLTFLFMGEIFPAAQRSLFSSVAVTFNLFTMFVTLKSFHFIEKVSCGSLVTRS